jgi:hypothetical protein
MLPKGWSVLAIYRFSRKKFPGGRVCGISLITLLGAHYDIAVFLTPLVHS